MGPAVRRAAVRAGAQRAYQRHLGFGCRPDQSYLCELEQRRQINCYGLPHRQSHRPGGCARRQDQQRRLSPDGKILFGGGADGRVRLWNVTQGALKANTPIGHNGAITDLELSGTRNLLVTLGADQLIRFWRLESKVAARRRISGDRTRRQRPCFQPGRPTAGGRRRCRQYRALEAWRGPAAGLRRVLPDMGDRSGHWRSHPTADICCRAIGADRCASGTPPPGHLRPRLILIHRLSGRSP